MGSWGGGTGAACGVLDRVSVCAATAGGAGAAGGGVNGGAGRCGAGAVRPDGIGTVFGDAGPHAVSNAVKKNTETDLQVKIYSPKWIQQSQNRG
jgi:hypothetical protein